jgi:hypothetical protein
MVISTAIAEPSNADNNEETAPKDRMKVIVHFQYKTYADRRHPLETGSYTDVFRDRKMEKNDPSKNSVARDVEIFVAGPDRLLSKPRLTTKFFPDIRIIKTTDTNPAHAAVFMP